MCMGLSIARSLSIILDKEERFVPDDGPTHGCAELVFPERRRDSGRSEEILGGEDVIAEKFVNASMEIIGPRFCNDVDYAAGFSHEFRIVIRFCSVEFAGGVTRWTLKQFVELPVR